MGERGQPTQVMAICRNAILAFCRKNEVVGAKWVRVQGKQRRREDKGSRHEGGLLTSVGRKLPYIKYGIFRLWDKTFTFAFTYGVLQTRQSRQSLRYERG